mmetsp:Transcript_9535/g.17147  ORF Transcript_9535/g.17147 Transcript_9535/m.17147 type:complete len:281 (-) Transcript_9535:1923-2765(-)
MTTPLHQQLLRSRRGNNSSSQPLSSPPLSSTTTRNNNNDVSSLNFEELVNQYSIRAIRQQFLLPNNINNNKWEQGNDADDDDDDDDDDNDPPLKKEQQHPSSLSYRLKKQRRYLLGYSGRTATRWILTIITGLVMGFVAISLVYCTGTITRWRASIMHDSVHNWGRSLSQGVIFQTFLWTNLILALMSSALCVMWVPSAAGSGIPEVKAYLNGARSMQQKKVAYWQIFLVKIVGTILSVSSGVCSWSTIFCFLYCSHYIYVMCDLHIRNLIPWSHVHNSN